MDARAANAGRERFWTWTISALLAAAALGCFEWDHYRRAVRLATLPVTAWDRLVIGWLLLAKTLCLVAPPLLISETLARLGCRRSGQVLWFGGLIAVLFWLAVDLRVQQLTGNHLLHYLSFEPSAHRWAGDLRGLATPVLLAIGVIVGATAALCWLSGRMLRRLGTPHGWFGGSVCAAATAVTMIGVVPAHALVSCVPAVEQIHAALPCDPYAFALSQSQPTEGDRFRRAVHDALDPLFEDVHSGLVIVADPDVPPPSRLWRVGPTPHVVVIVLESLRRDVLTAGYMPKMAAWAERGLTCERHYSGSNCSHLGIFALLYARSPLIYWHAVDQHVMPQACASFHAAGYECSFLTSGSVDYLRMNEFLKAPAFERVEIYNQANGWPAESSRRDYSRQMNNWPNDDRVVLRRAKQILQSDRPQFLMLFLMSTHFPYSYPPGCECHRPVIAADQLLRATPRQKNEVLNRYRNSAQFLDDELAELIRDLDPKKHLIALTGDHGESHFDDGTLTHWGRMSDQQCCPPLVVVGEGIAERTISTATTHSDLLPTLLHALSGENVKLRHSTGRDLLAGPQPDEAFLCTKYNSSPHWEAVMIRGHERLALRLTLEPRWLQVMGWVDKDGRSEPLTCRPLSDASGWAEAIHGEWKKLAR
jgi:Sulfatase